MKKINMILNNKVSTMKQENNSNNKYKVHNKIPCLLANGFY